jgi:hypothetical protein
MAGWKPAPRNRDAQNPQESFAGDVVVFTRSLLLLTGIGSLAGFLYACPSVGEKDPVKVTLVVILASEAGDKIDPRLRDIAAEVQKVHPHLKNFTLKHMESKSLKYAEKVSLPAVENKKVDMVIKHGADKDNRVGIAVTAPSMGEIEYRSVCGKFLPIVTRYQTKSKELLILAIRVQPCRGD